MNRLPHVKLTKHEFIMLRSLAKQSWQSTDPVVWRMNREWRAIHAVVKDARPAAEQLWRRGLVDAVPLIGFSPLTPGEVVKRYSLNDRGVALLRKANNFNTQPYEVIPQLMTLRPGGSIWGRILHSLRRRRADSLIVNSTKRMTENQTPTISTCRRRRPDDMTHTGIFNACKSD